MCLFTERSHFLGTHANIGANENDLYKFFSMVRNRCKKDTYSVFLQVLLFSLFTIQHHNKDL